MERIETLYDKGTTEIVEDRVIFCPPFFGVADGVSGLYLPSEGPRLFDGLSGGAMAAETLFNTIRFASSSLSLSKVIAFANRNINKKQKEIDLAYLAGAVFSIAKIKNKRIEILQCGNCFALWETISGVVGITENQTFRHDSKALRIIAKLMKKHHGNRNAMWREFFPILAKMKRHDINRPGGYGILNGEISAPNFFTNFFLHRKEIKILLLFSNGLINYLDSQPGEKSWLLARKILADYKKNGGLNAILEKRRKEEEKEKKFSHIDHAEASAVAITF